MTVDKAEAIFAHHRDDSDDEECNLTEQDITNAILSSFLFYCDLRDHNAELFILYPNTEHGTWLGNHIAENIILKDVTQLTAGTKGRVQFKPAKITEFIRGKAMMSDLEPKPHNLIYFKNGFFNLDTGKLESQFPIKYFSPNQIPWDYNPEARCPDWELFLDQVQPDKTTHAFIQELFGNALVDMITEPCFTICVGNGQNGKSTFLRVLLEMVGENNNTSISIQDLSYDRFKPAELYHKLTNISDDIGNIKITMTGNLKNSSAGARMNVNRKFGQPFDFDPYADQFYACNDPPEITDSSDAMKIRVHVLDFPIQFVKSPGPGQAQAKDSKLLMARLRADIPGVINWSIEGYIRFRDNGSHYTPTKSTEEMWNYLARKANPVKAWLEEAFTGKQDDLRLIEDAVNDFKVWMASKGITKKVGRNVFFRTLNDEGIDKYQDKATGQRYYRGLGNAVTRPTPTPPTNLESFSSKEKEEVKESLWEQGKKEGVTELPGSPDLNVEKGVPGVVVGSSDSAGVPESPPRSKEYHCILCGTTDPKHHGSHVVKHIGSIPCLVCGQMFANQEALNSHLAAFPTHNEGLQ
jgi:P4 family phage/plasmid primase-like protien